MQTLNRWITAAGLTWLLLIPNFLCAQTAPAAAKAGHEKKAGKAVPTAPVDLNTASQAELETVKGIGAATAKKIIANRPYASVAELKKAGISAWQITSITPMVKVSGTAPAKPSPVTKAAPLPNPAALASRPAENRSASSTAPAMGGGAGMVWVNKDTKIFHRNGDRWYGKTKNGAYMPEADAIKAGYHESKERQKK